MKPNALQPRIAAELYDELSETRKVEVAYDIGFNDGYKKAMDDFKPALESAGRDINKRPTSPFAPIEEEAPSDGENDEPDKEGMAPFEITAGDVKPEGTAQPSDTPRTVELEESLRFMVDNIGQPRSQETREGFEKAERLLSSLKPHGTFTGCEAVPKLSSTLPAVPDNLPEIPEGWVYVGMGSRDNRGLKPSNQIRPLTINGTEWSEYPHGGNSPSMQYIVIQDAPADIWERFGLEKPELKPKLSPFLPEGWEWTTYDDPNEWFLRLKPDGEKVMTCDLFFHNHPEILPLSEGGGFQKHTPGDLMPCEGDVEVDVLLKGDVKFEDRTAEATYIKWSVYEYPVIAWRPHYAQPAEKADECTVQDGWIPWGGGECPVHDHVEYEVKYRDGATFVGRLASSCFWDHDGTEGDIIAYRIVKDGGEG